LKPRQKWGTTLGQGSWRSAIDNRLAEQRLTMLMYPALLKCTPSLAVTFFSSAILVVVLLVAGQPVAQQVSRTLKFLQPRLTNCLIKTVRSAMKSVRSVSLYFCSFALVQWPVSLQHRTNKNLGIGGITTQGMLPRARMIGDTEMTIFLNCSTLQQTTLPPRWKMPLL
jgi:hypothetical protein